MLLNREHSIYSMDQQTLQRQLADKIIDHASIDEIQRLLVRGAQPNKPVAIGLTPLHYACRNNYFGAAELLLNEGAKVDAVDDVGCSALHLCAEYGFYRMIKLLLQYMEVVHQYEIPLRDVNGKYPSREKIDEPLRLAIKNGHFDCARLLLENGASPNAIYFDGPEISHVSPLDTNFIELLLEHGANPNVYDRKGMTPMMRACRLGENGIPAIRILHKYGADVNMEAEARQDRRTAMHYALLSGNKSLVLELIKLGARVNMPKDYDKPSILDIAVVKDEPELLQTILEAGAEVNAIHTYIGSALHLAASSILKNQYEILKLLLERGAQVNMQHTFSDGSTLKSPFVDYFRSRDVHDPRVVDLLVSFGGRVIMKSPLHDTRGQLSNVLKLAATKEQPEVLATMISLAESFDVRAIERHGLPLDIKGEIVQMAKNPASLEQICRLALRNNSKPGPINPAAVANLTIPQHLKGYVLGLLH